MTPWLKRPHPEKGPPAPASVDVETFWAKIQENRSRGIAPAAQTFLAVKAPPVPMDDYGMPLPLSSMDQDYLDRIFAVCMKPYERGTALLHSGQLCPDEVEPIATAFPEIYETMMEQARADMLDAGGPPFPAWVETTLTVLFQKPVALVYNPKQEQTEKDLPRGKVDAPEGTQADRRELAVRERDAA